MMAKKEICVVSGTDLIETKTKEDSAFGIADGEGHMSLEGRALDPFTAAMSLSSKIVLALWFGIVHR